MLLGGLTIMKKKKILFVAVIMLISMARVSAQDLNSSEKGNEIEYYEDLMVETTIHEEIVIYDESKGIDLLDEIEEMMGGVQLRGWENEGDLGQSAAADLRSAFSSISWLLRDVWSLSVTPKNWYETVSTKEKLFNSIQFLFIQDWQWNRQNPTSMANQFYCHYDFGRTMKSPWNIEPSKPDKGYWGFVEGLCN